MKTNKYQQSFLALAQTKKLKCERFLNEMDTVIPWDEFLTTILTQYHYKSIGRTKTDALLLLRNIFSPTMVCSFRSRSRRSYL